MVSGRVAEMFKAAIFLSVISRKQYHLSHVPKVLDKCYLLFFPYSYYHFSIAVWPEMRPQARQVGSAGGNHKVNLDQMFQGHCIFSNRTRAV